MPHACKQAVGHPTHLQSLEAGQRPRAVAHAAAALHDELGEGGAGGQLAGQAVRAAPEVELALAQLAAAAQERRRRLPAVGAHQAAGRQGDSVGRDWP